MKRVWHYKKIKQGAYYNNKNKFDKNPQKKKDFMYKGFSLLVFRCILKFYTISPKLVT